MRKHPFKTIRLFLKITLLFQIYCDHCFRTEAVDNNFSKSFNEGKVGKEPNLIDQSSDKETGLTAAVEKQKRPVRLLPLKIFL